MTFQPVQRWSHLVRSLRKPSVRREFSNVAKFLKITAFTGGVRRVSVFCIAASPTLIDANILLASGLANASNERQR